MIEVLVVVRGVSRSRADTTRTHFDFCGETRLYENGNET